MGADLQRPKVPEQVGDTYYSDVSLLFDGSSVNGASMDLSPSSRLFTVNNVVNPTTAVSSPYGGTTTDVLQFSGSSSKLTASSNDAALRDWDGTDTSYEMWVYLPSLTTGNAVANTGMPYPLFSHSRDNNGTQYFTFGWRSNGSLGAYYWRSAEQHVQGTSGAVTASKWHHVAWVYTVSDDRLRAYVDGVINIDYSVAGTPTNSSAEQFFVGHGSFGHITGYITDVRITYGTARHINTGGTYTYPVPTSPIPTASTVPPVPYQDPGNVDRVTASDGVVSLDFAGPESTEVTEVTLADYTAYSETQFTASNAAAGDNFGSGCAVSGDGTIAVFGSPFVGTNTGRAYVYENGTEVAILSGLSGGSVGFDVAISKDGSTIAASAYAGDSSDGVIYIFEKPANGWANATSSIQLTHTPDQANENLGITLAISDNGDTVVAGTSNGSISSYKAEAFVFEKPSGGWASMATETAKLSAASGVYSDEFSYGLAISGDGSVIAVGAPQNDGGQNDSGTVYLYDKPSGGWVDATETHLLSGPARIAQAHFGVSCSLNEDGTVLVVGENSWSSNRGRVHVLEDLAGTWTHVARLTSTATTSNQYVGTGVAVSRDGTTVSASAPGYNSSEGAIYVWTRPSTGWADKTDDYLLTAANGAAGDQLGGPFSGTTEPPSKVALTSDGGKVFTSTPYDDDNGSNSGSGFQFTATTTVPSTTQTTREGSQWHWNGKRGADNIDASNTPAHAGVVSLSEWLQNPYEPFYTFEMWGAGGGGGGAFTNATQTTEHSGPGGNGAFVSGTIKGLASGTVIELLAGGAGVGGVGGIDNTSGTGGGASAIRIQNGAVLAAAGGGGGGGGSGGGMPFDSTGGRGGNSVDGGNPYAANVGNNGGQGGQSGSATTAGVGWVSQSSPPAKSGTNYLQNGGDGQQKNGTTVGNGTAATSHPATWGGQGGDSALEAGGEGPGGGGGGGYFGGAGGQGAPGGNDGGAGGGGGGSYANSSYVSQVTSAEGSFETTNAHSGAAINQAAGSGAINHSSTVGKGGDGTLYTGTGGGGNGQPGAVYIYDESGSLVASVTTSAGTTTYTLP